MKKISFIALVLISFFVFIPGVNALTINDLGNNTLFLIGDCVTLLGNPNTTGSLAYMLQEAFDVMKFVAPILVLVFSVYDYARAAISGDKDEVLKVSKKTVKRIILGIAVFLIPFLLSFVLNLLEYTTCGIS